MNVLTLLFFILLHYSNSLFFKSKNMKLNNNNVITCYDNKIKKIYKSIIKWFQDETVIKIFSSSELQMEFFEKKYENGDMSWVSNNKKKNNKKFEILIYPFITVPPDQIFILFI